MAVIVEGLEVRLKVNETTSLHSARIFCTEGYAPCFLTCFLSWRLVTEDELALIDTSHKHSVVLRTFKKGSKYAALVQFFLGNLSDQSVAAMYQTMRVFNKKSKEFLVRMLNKDLIKPT